MSPLSWSLREAADQLGLNPGKSGTAGAQRLYKMHLAGRLRAVRIGRTLRVPVAELERLLSGKE